MGKGQSFSLSLDLVAWPALYLRQLWLLDLILLTRTVCNCLADCRGSFLPVKWMILVKTKIFVIVEIEKGKHDFLSVPDAKCFVCLFHLWWFCKLLQWVAAEQLPHASTVHLTCSRCDAWLTVHLTISNRLTRKTLKSSGLSLICDCLVVRVLPQNPNECSDWFKGWDRAVWLQTGDRGWSRAKKPTKVITLRGTVSLPRSGVVGLVHWLQ